MVVIEKKGEEMHVVDLIAKHFKTDLPEKPEIGICCLTGCECETISRKFVFSSNFTNYDLLLAPESDRISVNAYITFSQRDERSTWFVDEHRFLKFDKNIFRDFFLKGVADSETWAIYITTSYKKHGSLVTKINNGHSGIWRFEQMDVNARDLQINSDWYFKIYQALVEFGIGRSIIESLDCSPYLIGKMGMNNWIQFYKWAKDKYQSPLYKICCYLLPSQEELKNDIK